MGSSPVGSMTFCNGASPSRQVPSRRCRSSPADRRLRRFSRPVLCHYTPSLCSLCRLCLVSLRSTVSCWLLRAWLSSPMGSRSGCLHPAGTVPKLLFAVTTLGLDSPRVSGLVVTGSHSSHILRPPSLGIAATTPPSRDQRSWWTRCPPPPGVPPITATHPGPPRLTPAARHPRRRVVERPCPTRRSPAGAHPHPERSPMPETADTSAPPHARHVVVTVTTIRLAKDGKIEATRHHIAQGEFDQAVLHALKGRLQPMGARPSPRAHPGAKARARGTRPVRRVVRHP